MSEGPADDPFAPPDEPCEVWCLHCRRVYDSSLMRWVAYETKNGVIGGFWVCPVPNCDGKGFTFDIFPTDPAHPANEGWSDDSEEGEVEAFEEDDDADESDEEFSEELDAEFEPYVEGTDATLDSLPFDLSDDDEEEGEGFHPHADWTPTHDLAETDPDQYMEDGSPRRFTIEDYNRAMAEGTYEQEDADLRQRMRQSDRGSNDFRDEDIPF